MSRFGTSFWGALLGTFVAFFLGTVILVIGLLFIFGIFSSGLSGEKPVQKKKGSFLHLRLKGEIPDRPFSGPLSRLIQKYSGSGTLALRELTQTIREAAMDEDITGIFLDEPQLEAGMATLEELRAALLDFKASGKPIIAFSSNFSQQNYFLASVADELYLNPLGMVGHVGLAGQFISFKNLLDKLGIRAQLIRPDSNAYKSAAEPFLRERMSAENREQLRRLLDVFWNRMVADIANGRKTAPTTVQDWASGFIGREAASAVRAGMADGVRYYDEILALLKERSSSKADEPPLISAENYFSLIKKSSGVKDKIVILYAEGGIADESNGNERKEIVGRQFAELLRKARNDKKVKGVVLRVNSPGGSAVASEIIHREVLLTRAVKPVYVSMGNYAASGGYYIACGADSIFADATTLTGSIGVFGLLPDLTGFFKHHLGIQRDTILTATYADVMTVGKPLNEKEFQVFKSLVKEVYDTFLVRVAEGRRLDKGRVHQIAQGRVWSGQDAKDLGLVDSITTLEGVVTAMKKRLGSSDFIIEEWPKEEGIWKEIFRSGIFSHQIRQLFSKKLSFFGEAKEVLDYEYFVKPGVWAIAPKLVMN